MFSLKNNKDKLGFLLILLGFIFLLVMAFISFSHLGIWFDETFSTWMVNHNFNEMLYIMSLDVHPPLFYIMFYFATQFCSLFNFTNFVIIGKVVSLLPIFLTFILGITKVRKNFGLLASGLFCLTLVASPQIMAYAVQIRMYSWALFFITASVIYIYEILYNESSYKNWIILTVLTICSCYIHYFSLIASLFIYIFLLIYLIRNNKDKIKAWLISAVVVVLAYLPWVGVLINQQQLHAQYWIEGLSLAKVIGFIFFPLSPKNEIIAANEIVSVSILGLLLLIGILVLIWHIIKIKDNSSEVKFSFSCILLGVFVVLFGILISLLITPYFHVRYMVPILGCLWLGVSILLAKSYDKKYLFVPLLILILVCSVVGGFTFYDNQLTVEQADHGEKDMLNGIFDNNSVIIVDSYSPYLAIKYHLPNQEHYLLNLTENPLSGEEVSKDVLNQELSKVLGNANLEGKTVYFVQIRPYDGSLAEVGNYTLTEVTMINDFPYINGVTTVYRLVPNS